MKTTSAVPYCRPLQRKTGSRNLFTFQRILKNTWQRGRNTIMQDSLPRWTIFCGTGRCWKCLFGFSYRWEVYTPVAKRKFGYYVLPVLYNDRFVARFEAEPVREAGAFVVRNWWWEPQVVPNDEMRETIAKEMARFAAFLQVENAPQNSIKLGV